MLREEDNEEDISGYDLGGVRSHRDYERYAGIDFAGRRLHQDAMKGVEPPCAYVDERQWEEAFASEFNLLLKWRIDDIEKCDDFHFIYFGVEDRAGNVVYRYDASPSSPEAQLRCDSKKANFRSANKPEKLIVWPVSKSRGWLKKLEYAV